MEITDAKNAKVILHALLLEKMEAMSTTNLDVLNATLDFPLELIVKVELCSPKEKMRADGYRMVDG